MVRLIGTLFFTVLLAACMKNGSPAENRTPETPPANSGQTPQQTEWSAIEQLEAQAKSIAKADGCTVSGDCRSAAVGSKGCGGPRYYLTYCAKSTDTVALKSKLDEVVKAEMAYNKKYQVISTCEMRLPPEVELAGGSCRAK
jgi:hypothetical protein